MKKDILNELTGLDDETVNEIAENAPELKKAEQERILKKCMAKDMSGEVITVKGTEHYKRPKYRSFAAAAAAVVLIGGIGGAFAVGRNMKRNAPVESKVGLLVTTESTEAASDGQDKNNTEAQPPAPTEGTTGNEQTTAAPGETAYIEKPTQSDPLWLDPEYAEIDVAQPTTEYTVPDNVDDEQYEAWMKEIPEEYWDVVRNLKPGEVIHLPCIPVSEIPTDSGEPATSPPQTTTLPPETTVSPQTTTSPSDTTVPVQTTTEPSDKKTPDMYNPMTNQAVIQPIDGYWISDWCGSSYWWFDSQKHLGMYYNSNTCSGFNFSYNYYTSDSHIELMALDRGNGYSGTLYGTGNVVWISDDNFYIEWKEETPIRQGGDSFERFVRNKAESMPEAGDTQKPQPE